MRVDSPNDAVYPPDADGNERCPLCGGRDIGAAIEDCWGRRHFPCSTCRLIFTARELLLPPEKEKARYSAHQNGPGQPGYVAFLQQALDAARPFLPAGGRGLDYGCGPGPTLSGLLREEGFPCDDFDPFFHPQTPTGPYDFIFATEVVEHFYRPAAAWAEMLGLLRPGGLLVVMTEFLDDAGIFPSWWYVNDFTHVAFYHAETMDWLCRRHALCRLPSPLPRVLLFEKIPAGATCQAP